MGLGLSICQSLVEKMQGRIALASNLEKGAMVIWSYSKMKSTVLLIDDDQDVLDSYLHLMSIAGLTAKAVIDPTQAMSHIQPDWNGVVLLDMYMPQLHGMELLKQIKP